MVEQIRKAKLIYLIEILKNKTDENHPMSADEICDELLSLGITAERKAIYKDIDILKACGYDVIKTGTPKRGFFLGMREFELAEVRLLIDAVSSAGFISKNKTGELVKKLGTLASEYDAAEMKKRVHLENRAKSNNESIYYMIEDINSAIVSRKKIEFDYIKYDFENGKPKVKLRHHKISPYAFIWDSDHYYLVGNNEKYDNLIHLRLDRMKNVRITTQNIRHFSEVSSYKYQFDTADYATKAFNMYGGEIKKIEIECKDKLLDQMYDKFGMDIWVRKIENTDSFKFTALANVSDGLIGWLMQYGSDLKVTYPTELVEKMKQTVKQLYELYQ